MLRVGFIGCGRISDLHFPAYASCPGARLYAVCDANPEKAQRRRDAWNAEIAYTDYRELLEDPKIHAVEVLTPYDTHEEIVVAAARAGNGRIHASRL